MSVDDVAEVVVVVDAVVVCMYVGGCCICACGSPASACLFLPRNHDSKALVDKALARDSSNCLCSKIAAY